MTTNPLPGNPHLNSANSEHCSEDAYRVTQATLALAFEQRTANLIAYEQGQWAAMQNNSLNQTGVELWKEAADQISARLGLEKGK